MWEIATLLNQSHALNRLLIIMGELQFSSVQLLSCVWLWDTMDCSMPGFPVHHQVPETDSYPSSWWCHPTISSSIVSFSSYLQSFSASGSLPLSQFFTSGGQSIGVSVSASVLPWTVRLISFISMDWLDLLAVQGTLKSLLQHHSSKVSILPHSAFFMVQLSHSYMTTGKTITLTRRTFVGKVMSLLFNMLSRLVIDFLPRSKGLLTVWMQSPPAVIWSPPK